MQTTRRKKSGAFPMSYETSVWLCKLSGPHIHRRSLMSESIVAKSTGLYQVCSEPRSKWSQYKVNGLLTGVKTKRDPVTRMRCILVQRIGLILSAVTQAPKKATVIKMPSFIWNNHSVMFTKNDNSFNLTYFDVFELGIITLQDINILVCLLHINWHYPEYDIAWFVYHVNRKFPMFNVYTLWLHNIHEIQQPNHPSCIHEVLCVGAQFLDPHMFIHSQYELCCGECKDIIPRIWC